MWRLWVRLTCLIGVMLLPAPLLLAAADIACFHTETLTVKQKGDRYSLEGEVEIEKRFLTDRAAEDPFERITEQYFSKIDKIKAWHDDKKLDKDLIHKLYSVRRDAFFNEERTWILQWPSTTKKGDRIRYQYREKYDDLAYLPALVVANLNELSEITFHFVHPDDIEIDFEFFFPREEIPYTIERPSPKETILSFGTIPYAEPLPYFDYNDLHCAALPRFTKTRQLVNPVSVESFCHWYWEEIDFLPDFLPGQLAGLTEQFTGDDGRGGRLQQISDYVRENFRYVLDASRSHSIWPQTPAVLLDNKYGDCKDRAYLVRAVGLLDGLNVHLATINYNPDIPFAGTHATMFNHVICAVDSDTGLVFFDPTAKFHSFGSLAESLVGRRAVILDPDNPRRVEIPNSIEPPRLWISILGQPEDLSHCAATIEAGGEFRAAVARARYESTDARFEEAMDELITERLTGIALDSFAIVEDSEDQIVLTAVANLARFVTVSPKRVYIPQMPMTAVKPDILTRETDAYPINFDYRQDWKLSLTFAAPGVRTIDDSTGFQGGDGVSYKAVARQLDGDSSRFVFHFKRSAKTFQDGARADFLGFCRQYLQSKNQMFTIEGVEQ